VCVTDKGTGSRTAPGMAWNAAPILYVKPTSYQQLIVLWGARIFCNVTEGVQSSLESHSGDQETPHFVESEGSHKPAIEPYSEPFCSQTRILHSLQYF
jgi:hypothetical protein